MDKSLLRLSATDLVAVYQSRMEWNGTDGWLVGLVMTELGNLDLGYTRQSTPLSIKLPRALEYFAEYKPF